MDTDNCGNPPEGSSCQPQPELWYILRTCHNFHVFMRQYHGVFAETVGGPVHVPLTKDLTADFLVKVTHHFSPFALLNTLVTILSVNGTGSGLVPGG